MEMVWSIVEVNGCLLFSVPSLSVICVTMVCGGRAGEVRRAIRARRLFDLVSRAFATAGYRVVERRGGRGSLGGLEELGSGTDQVQLGRGGRVEEEGTRHGVHDSWLLIKSNNREVTRIERGERGERVE